MANFWQALDEDDFKLDLSCQVEYDEYIYNEEHQCWCLISLKKSREKAQRQAKKQLTSGQNGRREKAKTRRAPICLVAVIDKSASMAGEKLRLVKIALEFVLEQLEQNDKFSIVTYDDHVYVDFQLSEMSSKNRSKAQEKLQRIRHGSCTNLCDGLLEGLSQLSDRNIDKHSVASVLLFTDGLANKGVKDTDKIINAMKKLDKFSELESTQTTANHSKSCSEILESVKGFLKPKRERILTEERVEKAGGKG